MVEGWGLVVVGEEVGAGVGAGREAMV